MCFGTCDPNPLCKVCQCVSWLCVRLTCIVCAVSVRRRLCLIFRRAGFVNLGGRVSSNLGGRVSSNFGGRVSSNLGGRVSSNLGGRVSSILKALYA